MVGLAESFYSASEGTVGYQVGSLQMTISIHHAAQPVDGWSQQLGWHGGWTSTPSWGVELASEAFSRVVEAIRQSAIEAHHEDPEWVGYWSFPVRDPMGYTFEISTPERSGWTTAT